jgi:ABC-2 type transport system permease protein
MTSSKYLLLLFRLKGRLLWRTFTRDTTALVGVILIILLFTPLALGGAIGALAGFFLLPPAQNEQLLRGVLLAIYLFWLLSLVLGFALNEDFDISKLFFYPISPRLIFLGTLLSSLLDIFVLLLLPTMLAVVIGFSRSLAAFPLVLAGVGLFFLHTLSLIQVLRLAGAGLLRSRRFRDVMIVLLPLFMIGIYVLFQLPTLVWRRSAEINWAQLLHSRAWEIINFLPPGLAARGIAAAEQGHYLASLGFLGILALLTLGAIYLAGWLVELIYAGEAIGGTVGKRAPRPTRPLPAPRNDAPAVPSRFFGFLLRSPEMQAIAGKEIKYLVRDPYFKANLGGTLYMMVMALFMVFRFRELEGREYFNLGALLLWGASSLMLLMECSLTFNIFGTEGFAAANLFLFPARRREILLGKNLVLFVALLAVNGVLLMIFCLVAGRLSLFPLIWLWFALATLLLVGAGNLVSVWFPYRIIMRGWRPVPQSASRNLAYGFAQLGIVLVLAVLALPVLACLIVPAFWVSHFWFAITIPFALVYAAGGYLLGLRLAENALAAREIEIIEKLTRTD